MSVKTPYISDMKPSPADFDKDTFLVGERCVNEVEWRLVNTGDLGYMLKGKRELAVYKFYCETAGLPTKLVSVSQHELDKYAHA